MISLTVTTSASTPKRVILDTDMAGDCDDAGALAVLHALADAGECEILAILTNRRDQTRASAAAVDAINTWYGRPALLIGTDKEGGKTRKPPRSPFTEALRDEFPNDIGNDEAAPDALDVYRRALSGAPDGSVTVCSVGALSNLEDLLRHERGLVVKKVRQLVVMGGEFPDSRGNRPETNIIIDIPAAKYVIQNWPGEIVFSGFEVGKAVHAGSLLKSVSRRNPVRRAFELRPYGGKRSIDAGKPAYDQTAILLAVRGIEPQYWNVVRGGRVEVSDDGHTRWVADNAGRRAWVKIKGGPKPLAGLIDRLMARPPKLTPHLAAPGRE